jgi:hypothetical protein
MSKCQKQKTNPKVIEASNVKIVFAPLMEKITCKKGKVVIATKSKQKKSENKKVPSKSKKK